MVKINFPFRVHYRLQNPEYTRESGVDVKVWKDDGELFAGVKTYGGTEVQKNGVITVKDTAVLHTWFNSRCRANSRLIDDAGGIWSIITPPEDIDAARRFISFKIERVQGGA